MTLRGRYEIIKRFKEQRFVLTFAVICKKKWFEEKGVKLVVGGVKKRQALSDIQVGVSLSFHLKGLFMQILHGMDERF